MNEISFILLDYAMDKSLPGRLIQSSPKETKNGRLWPLLRGGLSDYAVTEISQYVWWGSFTSVWAKVHKLTLHGGFSCPNRDGTIGRGGCTFCNVASFADEAQQHHSIAEQLAHQAHLVNRAKRYLAYFSLHQHLCGSAGAAFHVSTGGQPCQYRRVMRRYASDCVPQAVVDLLCEYKDQGYEVWLELGLQTAHDKTLRRINRGHDFACYQRTTRIARSAG